MKNHFKLFALSLILYACGGEQETSKKDVELKGDFKFENSVVISLSQEEANRLLQLPLECIEIQYPNKLNQVIGGASDLKSPAVLHPAFYGCFDWHSAVHGHWSLVSLLKRFPDLKESEQILSGLEAHLSKENIDQEIEYFKNEINQGFERMYGWAWLMKLADELNTWDHPRAMALQKNIKPLADLIETKVIDFLPRLQYPIRVGTHTNTAFAMAMIYDYAAHAGRQELKESIRKRANDFYLNDADCPMTWEPSGYDFLSPCLEEADLMGRILPIEEYREWLDKFLPELKNENYNLKPAVVVDRTDGHLVHLDGLNFSRAWCLFGIAERLPEYKHLINIANKHIEHSLPEITDENYEGTHWLASFALLALR